MRHHDEVSDALFSAAEYLSENGWHQGALFAPSSSEEPPACAMGALKAATTGHYQVEWQALTVLRKSLGLTGLDPDFKDLIAVWNDAPERTAEDVILALKRPSVE